MSGKIYQKAFPYLEGDEVSKRKTALAEKYGEAPTPLVNSPVVRDLILRHIPRKGAVLDVGCAGGYLFRFLHANGYSQTYGADIQDFLSVERPRAGFQALDMNFGRFPWQDGFFGGITALEIFEHLENPFHFIRETARILGASGRLILTTPNPDCLFNKLSFLKNGEFYRFSDRNDHIALLTAPVFKKCVLKHFELVERRYIEGEFPYRWFRRFRYPENKFFGRSVLYVLTKRKQ